MALTKPEFETQYGLIVEYPYFRIDTFRGDRHNVRVGVGVYANADLQKQNKPALQTFEFSLPTPNTSGNMFADVYAYLKTLPEFEGAEDV